MTNDPSPDGFVAEHDPRDYDAPVDRVDFNFGVSRRDFVRVLGAGLLIAVFDPPAIAEGAPGGGAARPGGGRPGGGRGGGGARGAGGGGPAVPVSARLHVGKDNTIT